MICVYFGMIWNLFKWFLMFSPATDLHFPPNNPFSYTPPNLSPSTKDLSPNLVHLFICVCKLKFQTTSEQHVWNKCQRQCAMLPRYTLLNGHVYFVLWSKWNTTEIQGTKYKKNNVGQFWFVAIFNVNIGKWLPFVSSRFHINLSPNTKNETPTSNKLRPTFQHVSSHFSA